MNKFVFFILLFSSKIIAQTGSLGLPPILNFQKNEYRAGTQNWDIAQDRAGRILAANNEGLLVFDGSAWQLFPISNGTCVRSLAVAEDGKIFVGGQGEIGFFAPDERGRLRFESLNPLILAEKRQFTDVWDIAIGADGAVFFRCAERIFEFRNGAIRDFSNGSNFLFLGKAAGQKIIAQDDAGRLFFFDGEKMQAAAPQKIDGIVTAALALGDGATLLTTLKNGIFQLDPSGQIAPFQTPIDPFLREKRIYAAALAPSGDLALGTSLGGAVILGADRRAVQWLKKSEGLSSSNVLFVFFDRAGDLWLGLDGGLAHVGISSPFYRIFPDGSLEGAGYAAQVFGQKLFLGTSNGLFFHDFGSHFDPFERAHFRLVAGSTGQVWGLGEAGGELLMGHHEGAFRIQNGQAERLADGIGTWKFLPIGDSAVVAGRYDGLAFFKKGGPRGWLFDRKMPGLGESSRILVHESAGDLWVSHPYRGVFRADFSTKKASPTARFLGKTDGLPSDLNNYAFEIGGKMVVAAERGIFRFDAAAGRFAELPELDHRLGGAGRTRFLKADERGNIWFCKGVETGVLWVEDLGFGKKTRRQTFPQLEGQLVGGFEQIVPVGSRDVFFGAEKGFLHLQLERLERADTTIRVFVSRVFLTNLGEKIRDSLLASGFGPLEKIELPFSENSLRFGFGTSVFGAARRVEFSCRMDGLEKKWSAWSAKSEREFLSLPTGDYVFWVKARNEFGVESPAARFAFSIRAAWWAGFWAKFFYALGAVAAFFAFFKGQKRRFETEKTNLTDAHRRQTEAQNQELGRLKNEKLENEVAHKNQELALATMHLVQKGELLSGIQEELARALEKNSDPKALRDDLARIVRTLQLDEQTDDDWAQFAIHFDSVHGDFLKRLREKWPQLTPNDHRLCAYLRMNLTTKEIANLLNISVRGVEGSRYRLRKKMGLAGDANLGEVMNGL